MIISLFNFLLKNGVLLGQCDKKHTSKQGILLNVSNNLYYVASPRILINYGLTNKSFTNMLNTHFSLFRSF